MRKHEKLGHLSPALSSDRDKIYKDMMSIAKKSLDDKEYKAFYAAF